MAKIDGRREGGRGAVTRTAILDAAETLILEQGFAATAIDSVLDRTGLTKGAFFHHFRSKGDLALALVERYAQRDGDLLDANLDRAIRLARDPVQQVLVFVGLFIEMFAALRQPNPGCLFATYCYEAQLFDERTLAVVRAAMLHWRQRFGAKLDEAIQRTPPRLPVTADALADMITVIFEGAFVLSKTLNEPGLVAEQLAHYRNYLELLFGREGAAPAPADR